MSKSIYFRSRIAVLAASIVVLSSAAIAQPDLISRSFSQVVKRVEPAVVSIDTKSRVVAQQPIARGNPQPGDSDSIMEFFRRQPSNRPVYAVGSGFIVDKSGYIVTNRHVVDDAARITVRLDSGEELQAKVVGDDEETDIAVLKVEAGRDLPFVKFADSEKAEVGDWVLTIGSPFNLAKTVSAGIISTTKRETPGTTPFQRFIQTDAVINPGNSGGPLVNIDGEVVGVNSQIATATGEYNGVGFALPSNQAAYVYDQILKNGKVRRGYLGAYLESVKVEYAKVYKLPDAHGAIVTEIRDKQGPAASAGLLIGDVISEFNGRPVADSQDLIAKIAATPPNESVSIGILRENGEKMEPRIITAKLSERPVQRPDGENPDRRPLPVDGVASTSEPLGLTLEELTPALAIDAKLQGQKGLVVKEVNPTSFIADVRNAQGLGVLSRGDVIQRINRVTVTELKAFQKIIGGLKVGDPVVLQVVVYNPVLKAPQTKFVQFTVK